MFSSRTVAQIGNDDGRYDKAIEEAYKILKEIKALNKEYLITSFTETGFQKKSEFKKNLSKKRLIWASDLIYEFDSPQKEDISISEWRISSKDESGSNEYTFSVNIGFFFKKVSEEYSNANNRININFKKIDDNTYLFDGLLFFKETEYIKVKNENENL